MDVCGIKGLRLHDKLRQTRLKHSIVKHKTAIIKHLYETYEKLVNNLTEDYYKQDIEMDVSVLNLDEEEINTQIQYYQQEYHRCAEIELNFLLSRSLKRNLEELRAQL